MLTPQFNEGSVSIQEMLLKVRSKEAINEWIFVYKIQISMEKYTTSLCVAIFYVTILFIIECPILLPSIMQ